MGCASWFFDRRRIEDVSSSLLDFAVVQNDTDCDIDECDYEVSECGRYIDFDVEEYHDVFRPKSHTDDVLRSYSETITYCLRNNIQLEGAAITRLESFFTNYPNGVIKFY